MGGNPLVFKRALSLGDRLAQAARATENRTTAKAAKPNAGEGSFVMLVAPTFY